MFPQARHPARGRLCRGNHQGHEQRRYASVEVRYRFSSGGFLIALNPAVRTDAPPWGARAGGDGGGVGGGIGIARRLWLNTLLTAAQVPEKRRRNLTGRGRLP